MKKTVCNEIEKMINSNTNFDYCFKERKIIDLYELSNSVYECAEESYQSDRDPDGYDLCEFRAHLYC